MDKKKGIIIAIVLLLLLSVGTFAFTRDNETEKLKEQGVSEKKNGEDKDSDTKTNSSNDLEAVNGQEETTPLNTNGRVNGVNDNAGNNATAPVFSLDDIKVDKVEFAENFTMPEKTITDTDGNVLTAVITYEYRANSSEEFAAATDFDTKRSGEYRVTYTITNKDGLSSSESFIVNVVDSVNPEITGTPVNMTNQDVTLSVTELNNYEVTVNGKVYTKELVFTESGNYEVVVTDAAGNSVTATFTIDKDVPVLNFGNGAIVREKEVVVTDDNFDYMTITNYLTGETITVKENKYTLNTENSDNVRFNIKAYDKAGNVSKYADIYLDNVNPAIEGTGINNNEEKTLENNGLYTKVSLKVTDGSLKKVLLVKEDGEEVLAELDNNYTNNKMTFEKVFDQDGTYTIKAVDRKGNEKTVTFTVDTTAPEAEVIYSTTEPTNHGVFVNIKTNEPVKAIEGWKKISDTEYQKAYGFNYTQDVAVTDLAGNTTTVTVSVKNIDKKAPVIKIDEAKSIGQSGVYSKVVVAITDEEGYLDYILINGYAHSTIKEERNSYGATFYAGKGHIKEGKNTLAVYDKAGNVSEIIEFTADSIAPVVTNVTQVYEAKQDGRIKATVTFSEPVQGLKSDWRKVSDTEYYTYFYRSKTVELNFKDLAENNGSYSLVIDKDAPIVTVTKSNNDKSTNQDVTVTLVSNEAMKTPEGWTKVDDTTFTRVYSENGKYSVAVEDLIGNPIVVNFEVKRIDKVAPDATITKSNNDKSTNQDVVVTLIANEAIYKPEGWTEVKTNKKHEFTKTYSENGKYSVEITDKAGNKTTVKFEVKRIDKVAPVVTVVDPNKYYIEAGSIYVDKGYSAYDVVDKDVSNTIKISYSFLAEGTGNWTTVDTLDTTKLGTYKVIYTANDKAGNSAKGTRVVVVRDTTAPVFKEYPESGFTDQDFIIDVEDIYLDTITISKRGSNEVLTVENGYVLKEEGSYILEAVDKSGNKARVNLGIDKTAPVVTGVEDGGYYNTNVTPVVTDLQLAGAIFVNGEKFASGTEITEEGTYTLVANDRVGHTTTVTFTIDKTSPAPTKVQVWNKDNASSNYIKNGETARIQATFTETLAVAPILTIGKESKEMTLIPGGNGEAIYSADIKIATEEATLAEGTLSFTISGYEDFAGNVGETFDQTKSNVTKNLIYDRTAPVHTSVNLLPSGNEPIPGVTNGARLDFYVFFEEQLGTVPTIRLSNGEELQMRSEYKTTTGYKYFASHKLTEGDGLVDGELTYEIFGYADKAGNVGEVITNENAKHNPLSQSKIIIDRTAPTIILPSGVVGRNQNEMYIEAGAKVNLDGLVKVEDAYDKNPELKLVKVKFYAPLSENNIENVDITNGLNTTKIGRYNLDYVAKDAAGNETTRTLMILIKEPTAVITYEVTALNQVVATLTASRPIMVPTGWERAGYANVVKKSYNINTTEEVELKDLYGNIGKAKVEIKNVDDSIATVESIEYSTTGYTNEDVTVTVTFSHAIYAPEGWEIDGMARRYKKTYSANATEEVEFTDYTNNKKGVFTVKVNNIDKTAPTAELTYSTVNGSIIATLTASKAILTPNGWTMAGRANVFTKTYDEATTEEVELKDLYGNVGSATVEVE